MFIFRLSIYSASVFCTGAYFIFCLMAGFCDLVGFDFIIFVFSRKILMAITSYFTTFLASSSFNLLAFIVAVFLGFLILMANTLPLTEGLCC